MQKRMKPCRMKMRLIQKMKKNQFDFEDYLESMHQMKKMGGLSNLLSMIPGVGNKMQGLDIDDSMMDKTAAIIYSMTKEERANPKIINASRKRRIAAGILSRSRLLLRSVLLRNL